MMFENSGKLTRFMLKRERVMSALWLVCLVAFSAALAPAMYGMFDDFGRQAFAMTMENPAMIVMMGPVIGADNFTTGAMYSTTMLIWVLITIAIMNIFLIARHTRADEEKGRAEVVRSLPVGRLSILNAAMTTAFVVNAALAVLTGLAITAMRVPSMGFGGSMLYGAALGVTGLFFAAVTALFCQLSSSSRGAVSLSGLALAVFYIMRAAGDLGNETLSLLSPLGLVQRARIYAESHWWPVLVVLLAAVVITAVAYLLNRARDLGEGYIPARAGRREAKPSLLSPTGFALRLLRNSIIAWFIAMFLLGASYGSILGDIEEFVAGNEFYAMIIGVTGDFTVAQMFSAMVNSMAALTCVVPLLGCVLKLRTEEREGRAEHILTRSVSRVKYLAGFAVPAIAASALFQLTTAFGLYLSAFAVLDEPIPLAFLLEANLVYLPALWVMLGAAILLIGILPRASGIVWAYFAFSFFTEFMGRILPLPGWLLRLSPFGFIPQLPADTVRYGVLLMLTGVAAVLTAVGFVFYRRRDVAQ